MKRIFRKRVKTEKKIFQPDDDNSYMEQFSKKNGKNTKINDNAKAEQTESAHDGKSAILDCETKTENIEEISSKKGKGHSGIFWKFKNKKINCSKSRQVCIGPYTDACGTKKGRKEQAVNNSQAKSSEYTISTSKNVKDNNSNTRKSSNKNQICGAANKTKAKERSDQKGEKNSGDNLKIFSGSLYSTGGSTGQLCVHQQSCHCTVSRINKQSKPNEPLRSRRERNIGDSNEGPTKREFLLQNRQTGPETVGDTGYKKFKTTFLFREAECQKTSTDSARKHYDKRESVYQEYRVLAPASKLSHSTQRSKDSNVGKGSSENEYKPRSSKPARHCDESFCRNVFPKVDICDRETIEGTKHKVTNAEPSENNCEACIHGPCWLGGRNSTTSQSLKMDMASFTSWLNLVPSERELSHMTNPSPEDTEDKLSNKHQANSNSRYGGKAETDASIDSMVDDQLEKTITSTSVYSINGDRQKSTAMTTNKTLREKIIEKFNQPDTQRTFEIATIEYFFNVLDMLIADKIKSDTQKEAVHKTNSCETQDGKWWMGRGKAPVFVKNGNQNEEKRPSIEISDTQLAVRNTRCKVRKNTTTSIYNVLEDRLNKLSAENAKQTRNHRYRLVEKFTQLAPEIETTDSGEFPGVLYSDPIDMTKNCRQASTIQRGCETNHSLLSTRFSVKKPGVTSRNVTHATNDNKKIRASMCNTEGKLESIPVENVNRTSSFTDQLMHKFSQFITPKIVEIESNEYIIITKDKRTTSIYNMVEDKIKTWASKNCNQMSGVTDEVLDQLKEVNIPRIFEVGSREYILAVGSKRKSLIEKCSLPDIISKTPLYKYKLSHETEHSKYVPIDMIRDEKQVEANLKLEGSGVTLMSANIDLYELGDQGNKVLIQTASDYNVQNQYFNTHRRKISNDNQTDPINATVLNTLTPLSYVSSSAIELTSKRSDNLYEVNWEPASYDKSTRTSINSDGSSKKLMYKQKNVQETNTLENRSVNSPLREYDDNDDHEEEMTGSFDLDTDGTLTFVSNDTRRIKTDSHRPNSLHGKTYTDKDSAYSTCDGSHKPINNLTQSPKKAEGQCIYCKRREFSSRSPKFQKTTQKSIYFTENERVGRKVCRTSDECSWYDVNNAGTQYTPTQSQYHLRDKVLSCIDYVIFVEPVAIPPLNHVKDCGTAKCCRTLGKKEQVKRVSDALTATQFSLES